MSGPKFTPGQPLQRRPKAPEAASTGAPEATLPVAAPPSEQAEAPRPVPSQAPIDTFDLLGVDLQVILPAAPVKRGRGAKAAPAADLSAPLAAEEVTMGLEAKTQEQVYHPPVVLPGPLNEPEFRQRVLDAAMDMSWAQSLNSREKDRVGFNNADFPLGAVLASSGDVEGCAVLLRAYPQQIARYGLQASDLDFALPMEMRDLSARSACSEALTSARSAHRGETAWTAAGDGKVVMVPYGVAWEDQRIIRLHGQKTNAGIAIEPRHLESLLQSYQGPIIGREALQALADTHKASAVMLDVNREPSVKLGFTKTSTGYQVDWTNPFSPEAQAVRDAVKKCGGAFDDRTKSWTLTETGAKYLPLLLEDNADVAEGNCPLPARKASAELRREADLMKEGVSPIRVGQATPQEIRISTLRRNFELEGICKEMGIAYTQHAYSLPTTLLPAFLTRADKVATLDATAVFHKGLPVFRKQIERLEQAASFLEGDIPTVTPTGAAFKPHQIEGIQTALTAGLGDPAQRGAIIADDMGLGKTLQSMMVAHLKDRDGKKLVLCPAIAKTNWHREITKFLGAEEGEATQVIKTGKDIIRPNTKWLVVNYNLLKAMQEKLMSWGATTAICDEAQVLTNRETMQTKLLLGYDPAKAKDEKGKNWVKGLLEDTHNVYPLTGTPINNRPEEMYPLLKLIRHPLSADWMTFGQRYCGAKQKDVGGKLVWDFSGSSNLVELGQKIKGSFIRRMKTEVLEGFPKKFYNPFPVELEGSARRAYDDLIAKFGKDSGDLSEALLSAESGTMSKKGAAAALEALTALKQATALSKIPAAIEYIEDAISNGEKILVFTNYTEVLDRIQAHFGQKIVRVDGSVTGAKRTEAEDRFQTDPDCLIFAGNIKACGVAINLTAASQELVVDLPWTPGALDQAADRAYRIGQTRDVNVAILMAENTFDADLWSVIENKREAISQIELGLAGERIAENDDPMPDDLRELARRLQREIKALQKKKAA